MGETALILVLLAVGVVGAVLSRRWPASGLLAIGVAVIPLLGWLCSFAFC